MKRIDCFLIFLATLLLGCPQARADPIVELSGAAGFGAFVAGVTPGRLAISPSASFSVRDERWFFVARNTASLLGANGGRFGINNETTLGGGRFWELVNVSAGLSLAAYSLPICGALRCGQVYGLAPGAGARLDLFGPYLSEVSASRSTVPARGSRAARLPCGAVSRCAARPGPSCASHPIVDQPERLSPCDCLSARSALLRW